MSRGKPSRQQLDMEEDLLTVIGKNEDCISENGTDCPELWRSQSDCRKPES